LYEHADLIFEDKMLQPSIFICKDVNHKNNLYAKTSYFLRKKKLFIFHKFESTKNTSVCLLLFTLPKNSKKSGFKKFTSA